MATDDYAVMAVVVGFAILVGFIFGKISQKADYNSRLDQKILISELQRWKLRPSYSNLLMEKKPEIVAQKELDLLLKQNEKMMTIWIKLVKSLNFMQKKWMY